MIVSHHTAWASQRNPSFPRFPTPNIRLYLKPLHTSFSVILVFQPTGAHSTNWWVLPPSCIKIKSNVSAMQHLRRTSACFRSRANFEPLFIPLQHDIRFFQHPKPAHMRTPHGYPVSYSAAIRLMYRVSLLIIPDIWRFRWLLSLSKCRYWACRSVGSILRWN